jgi:biotin transporter BioY
MKKKKKRPPHTIHKQLQTKTNAHRFALRQKKRAKALWEEQTLDGSMAATKTLWEQTQQHPLWNRFSVWMLILAGVALFLGSMVFLPVNNWATTLLQNWSNASLFTPPQQVSYCLQFPLFVLLIAWLGPRLGSLFLFAYLLIGLAGIPLFSGGGGWTYVLKPTFGYWLGGLFVLPWMVQQGQLLLLRGGNLPLWKIMVNGVLLAINTVLLMHTVGLLYLVVLGLLGQFPWEQVREVAVFYSLVSLPYDCLGALIALSLVRYLRWGTAVFLYA